MCDVDCGCGRGSGGLAMPGGCPSFASGLASWVRANPAPVTVIVTMSSSAAMAVPMAAPALLSVSAFFTLLRNNCDAERTIRDAAAQAVVGLDVLAAACTIAGVLAALGIVTIPLSLPLAGIAALAAALRVVCADIAAGRTPGLGSLGAAASSVGGLAGNSQLQTLGSFLQNVDPDDVEREMAKTTTTTTTTKTTLPQIKKMAIVIPMVLKDLITYNRTATVDELLDQRPVALTVAAARVQPWLAPAMRVAQAGPMGGGRTWNSAANENFVRAIALIDWWNKLLKTPDVAWDTFQAKAAIKDPSTAPTMDFGGREPVVDSTKKSSLAVPFVLGLGLLSTVFGGGRS